MVRECNSSDLTHVIACMSYSINTIAYVDCLCFPTECRGQETVDQPEVHVVSYEGAMVTLSCGYSKGGSSPDLFWYIQRPNDFPKLILRRDRYSPGHDGTEFNERFNSTLNFTSSSVPLIIQNLQVSDSAVYYCALRPTVTAANSVVIQKHRLPSHKDSIY